MNLQLIVLIEPQHPPVPPAVACEVFGDETIVNLNDGKLVAHGQAACLTGTEEDIRAWVESAGGSVWTSTNPMLGDWVRKTLAAPAPGGGVP